jgi:hypothetical protein
MRSFAISCLTRATLVEVSYRGPEEKKGAYEYVELMKLPIILRATMTFRMRSEKYPFPKTYHHLSSVIQPTDDALP